MAFIDIIERKKMGLPLSENDIAEFVRQAASTDAHDYQLAALLMAIRLNGMDARETTQLTLQMAASGHMLKPDVGGVPVDKHSTGGVGDTTTLVLVPLVAAAGGKVVKMSGRGLGHTGGTLDKLDSISGFETALSEDRFMDIVRRVGCAVVGQTADLAPADKRLYALRDVTSTVDSIPLIASSIMSKKLASGASAIVLDVKTGDGALMATFEDSLALARAMVDIGTGSGRQVVAFLTSMDEPLGSHVGNALEVKEAIDVLAGRVKGPLLDVSLRLGAQMLLLSGLVDNAEEGVERLTSVLADGSGLIKLSEMITAQGGDPSVCHDVSLLPQARHHISVKSPQDGYLYQVDSLAVGRIAQGLGAGRLTKEDIIDPAVGLVLYKRIGDRVTKGETLGVIHANDSAKGEEAAKLLADALHVGDEPVPPVRLIQAFVNQNETVVFE